MKEQRVKLGKEHTGLVLARDVYKSRNTLLLRTGSKLTESLIERLKRNGVEYVYVTPSSY